MPRLTGDRGVGGSRAWSRGTESELQLRSPNWIEGSTINPDKSTIPLFTVRVTGRLMPCGCRDELAKELHLCPHTESDGRPDGGRSEALEFRLLKKRERDLANMRLI